MVLAALCYLTPLWEALVGYPLIASRAYVSELAARDQALGWLFRLSDLAAGLLLVSATVLALRRLPRGVGLRRVLASCFVIAALGTIADVIFPMDCAESEARCAHQVHAGAVSLSHHIHLISSTIAVIAFLGAAALAVIISRRCAHRRAGLILALAVLMAVTLAAQGVCFAINIGLGWPQRVHVIATAGLIATSSPLLTLARQR